MPTSRQSGPITMLCGPFSASCHDITLCALTSTTPLSRRPYRWFSTVDGHVCGWFAICAAGTAYETSTCFAGYSRSEEHTSELQSRGHLVCRLQLEKKTQINLDDQNPKI